jgi:RluA family pseudouridine synthase
LSRSPNSESSRKLRTAAVDAGRPLAAWLAERLGLAPDAARALIERGSVYVDGKRVRDPARTLVAGAKLTVYTAPADPEPARDATPRVVVEGRDLLVVDKPARVSTQAGRHSALAFEALVARRYPGAVAMHRLDRDASGLVLFARTASGRKRLADAFRRGAVDREYVAFAHGHPREDQFTIESPIGPDPADRRRRRAGVASGEHAVTHVDVAERGVDAHGDPACRMVVRLETGRTHQIRVHLASIGHPLLGDPLYAPAPIRSRAPRLALHAARLRWPGGEAEAPLPDDLAAVLARR